MDGKENQCGGVELCSCWTSVVRNTSQAVDRIHWTCNEEARYGKIGYYGQDWRKKQREE